MDEVPGSILDWAARCVASNGRIVATERLRPHGGPWLLQFEFEGAIEQVILKCGPTPDWGELYTCEAAALGFAAEHDVPAPRVLGFRSDLDGGRTVALLLSHMPGTTQIPRATTVDRLHALGRTAAAIHRIPLEPSDHLPLRTRHTAWTNFALWRVWARRYRNAPEGERDGVLREFITEHPLGGSGAMTGAVPWSIDGAREALSEAESTPLLDAAGDRLFATPAPVEATVFVHGDLWQGNTLWEGDRCVGVIDWEVGGAGHPGVDLGCLRWDAAMQFGAWAAEEVLAGWEQAAGRAATAVPYWDLVAVLNYPTDMGRIVSSLSEQGRPDLDAQTLTERRDAYVEAALKQLDGDRPASPAPRVQG